MQKVVFINKPITEDLANNMIALTLYLDSLDKKRIYYWLNVPGGEVRACCALDGTALLGTALLNTGRLLPWGAAWLGFASNQAVPAVMPTGGPLRALCFDAVCALQLPPWVRE